METSMMTKSNNRTLQMKIRKMINHNKMRTSLSLSKSIMVSLK